MSAFKIVTTVPTLLVITGRAGKRAGGSLPFAQCVVVRVRIIRKPVEREVDGLDLKGLAPGGVRDVSTSLASWLIAEGYAAPEMRNRDRGADTDQTLGDLAHKRDRKHER